MSHFARISAYPPSGKKLANPFHAFLSGAAVRGVYGTGRWAIETNTIT